MRPINSLTAKDFAQYPVWRFCDDDSPDETHVEPERQFPVERTDGCIVGCHIRLANQGMLAGFLGNLDITNRRLTEHFLTLSVFRQDGVIFHLARYHDFDADQRGPEALAVFLGLPIQAVFPITYEVSGKALVSSDIIHGIIVAEPKEKLTRAELIALAVP
jgi:hypothetical protein